VSTLKRIALLLVLYWIERGKPENVFLISPKESLTDKYWKVSIEEEDLSEEWIVSKGNVHIGTPT
jgi:hypothetical protein